MTKCERKRRFNKLLKSARKYELICLMDLFLSVEFPQHEVSYRVERFVKGETSYGKALYWTSERGMFNKFFFKACGVRVEDFMYFEDVMKLKAKLNYKVIRFALENGEANKDNRSECFRTNYQEL